MSEHAQLPDGLEPLVAAALDGSLSPEDRAHLGELVADPAAREFYLEYLATHAVLQWSHDSLPALNLPDTTAKPRATAQRGPGVSLRTPAILSIAAAVLISAAVMGIWVVASSEHRTSNIEDRRSPAPVATLIESTDTVVVGDDIANPGSEYTAGVYSIEAGSAQFLLRNRVTVDLRGQTSLRVHNPMHATLERGAADFSVPAGAVGFTVALPDGRRVVDLGTRFSIELGEDGKAVISVHEGRVELRAAPDATGATTPVSAGSRARWLGRGVAIEPIEVADGDALPIADPSFETLDGWTIDADGFFGTAGLDGVDPAHPADGDRFLTANRDAAGLASNPARAAATQSIDLAPFDEAIDSGRATLDLVFSYSAKDGQDRATVSVTFRGVDGTPLGQPVSSGPLTNAPPTQSEWARGRVSGPVPAGARSLELTLSAHRTDGTRTNVSFDHLQGRIVHDEPTPGSPR